MAVAGEKDLDEVGGDRRCRDRQLEVAAAEPEPRQLGIERLAPRDLEPLAFSQAITEAAGGSIDVTADLVGGAYVTTDVLAAAPRGRIVLIGTLAGGRTDLPILAVMSKRLSLHGTVLRPRSIEEKAAATAAFAASPSARCSSAASNVPSRRLRTCATPTRPPSWSRSGIARMVRVR